MNSFKKWLEAMVDPAVAAAANKVAQAATNAIQKGDNSAAVIKASQKAAADEVRSGKVPGKKLGEILPQGEDNVKK